MTDVLSSRISTACPAWADRLREGRGLIPADLLDAFADAPNGRRLRRCLAYLRVPDLPGTPTVGELNPEWFLDFASVLGGSLGDDGDRGIKEALVLVPKKNAKTTFGSLMMLALMLTNTTPRKNYNFIAPTIEVANLAFRQAAGAVQLDARLSVLCHVQDHRKAITNRKTGAVLKVVPFTARATTGLRGTSLVDELHLCAQESAADRIMGQIVGALVGDPSAAVISISTQSERPSVGIFRTLLDRARAVRDGQHEDASFLPVLYEPPPGADPADEATWRVVNPNASASIERLRSSYAAAARAGPAEVRRWTSQHVNAESTFAAGEAWALAELWPTLARPGTTLADVLPVADLAVVGVDLGGGYDSTAATVLVRSAIDGTWFATSRGWVSHEAMNKRPGVDQAFLDWANAGEMTIGPAGSDIIGIADLVHTIAASGVEVWLGIDPHAGPVGELTAAVSDVVPEECIVGVGQGWRITPAVDMAERWALAGQITHDGGRYLAACVNNISIVERGPARSVERRDLQSKIDAAAALLNAIFVALHGAAEVKAEAICPWVDPWAARDVAAGDPPMSDFPDQPAGGEYVRLA